MDQLFPDPDARLDRGVLWRPSIIFEIDPLLEREHYLGPRRTGGLLTFGGFVDGECVAAQVWGYPSARYLPNDGTWIELQRWCLTAPAGPNAGSRMHRYVVSWLRRNRPETTTLVSYSDPSQGHTGALYRACNWRWAPTWMRLAPPPTGNGRWSEGAEYQAVKDRWIFGIAPDFRRDELRDDRERRGIVSL